MTNLTSNNTLKKVLSGATVWVLLVALQSTGVLWGFWRTLDNITGSAPTNSYQYGFGYGDNGFGYGFGYGYGATQAQIDAGSVWTLVNPNSGSNNSGSNNSGSSNNGSNNNGSNNNGSNNNGSNNNGSNNNGSSNNGSSNNGSSNNGSSNNGGNAWVMTCTDSQLVCKDTWVSYKLFKKSNVSCVNGNLGKACILTAIQTPVIPTPVTPLVPVDGRTVTNDFWGKVIVANGVAALNSCQFVLQEHTFLDDQNTFATKYITLLQELGIVDGRDGNGQLFVPESSTTRTEFLKMTLRIFCKDYSNTSVSGLHFTDVNKADWKAKVIAKALSENLITANNARFRPNDAISRIEAIKILTLVSGMTLTPTNTTVFTDVNANWMKKYAEGAKAAGIVNGQVVNGQLIFEPTRNMTRAEASKVIVRGATK